MKRWRRTVPHMSAEGSLHVRCHLDSAASNLPRKACHRRVAEVVQVRDAPKKIRTRVRQSAKCRTPV